MGGDPMGRVQPAAYGSDPPVQEEMPQLVGGRDEGARKTALGDVSRALGALEHRDEQQSGRYGETWPGPSGCPRCPPHRAGEFGAKSSMQRGKQHQTTGHGPCSPSWGCEGGPCG